MTQSLLEVTELRKHFPLTQGVVFKKTLASIKAVDGVSFSLEKGSTLGLVGESGSGKSTTGKLVLRLLEPTSGKILFNGINTAGLHGKQLKEIRKKMGMVFQDPFSSLDPRKNTMSVISEPLNIHSIEDAKEREEKVYELLQRVGLHNEDAIRYPHQFSGGQRQRIAIARALALSPDLVVADEPVSSLDVSVQAKTINLMMDLQRDFGLAYLFIAHDLSVTKHISDKVAVMYLGRIIEIGSKDHVFSDPLHPYTHALLAAVPIPDPDLMEKRGTVSLKGEMPSPMNPPHGCCFHPRCVYVQDKCSKEDPPLFDSDKRHLVACHYADDIKKGKLSKQ